MRTGMNGGRDAVDASHTISMRIVHGRSSLHLQSIPPISLRSRQLSGANRRVQRPELFTSFFGLNRCGIWLSALDDFRNWLIRDRAERQSIHALYTGDCCGQRQWIRAGYPNNIAEST